MTQAKTIELVRGIGRWSLVALVVNTVIGSGIFGLPSLVAGLLGGLSPIAVILGAAGIGVIAACFAEVSSRFRQAGGPYLYARRAFGPFIGIQTAWLFYLTRVTGLAANSNLFVIYLAEFWPGAREPRMRLLVLLLLVGGLAAINYVGVKAGARISDFFAVAKVLPLLIFIAVGIFFIHGGNFTVPHHAGPAQWFDALLILVFAFKGFEAALVPAGETQNPEHDGPWALFAGLALVTVIYTSVQVVVVGVLPNAGNTERPLADAAQVFMGVRGAEFLALGALLSIYGLMSSMMLNTPRLTFALAERGDFPPFMAAVHPRFRTPHISIVVFAVLVFLLASVGTFRWNVILSAIATLFIYVCTCAAVPALRQKEPGKAAFVLPAGGVFAALGILFCVPLALRMDRLAFWIILATIAIAGLNWFWARRKIGNRE